MRACHKTSFQYVTPELPAFEPVEVAVVAPARRVIAFAPATRTPHAPPALDRPAAPS